MNPRDESTRETFATGRPLEDSPDMQQCKHCKKSILRTAAKEHIAACLRVKKEKAQRKKEAREARERAREAAREEEARKNDDDGDGRGDEDSDEEVVQKVAGKTTKKAAGKKTDTAGKKRKADGEPDKAPKSKKKKDEPKAKTAKPKGELYRIIPSVGKSSTNHGICRPCRRRTPVWCTATERPAMREIPYVQEPQYGREACSSGEITTVRHASRCLPKEKPSQAAK